MIMKDIHFADAVDFKGERISLKLDIYKKDDVKNVPLVVLVHGGGFRYGNDKTQSYIVDLANRFAELGYVVASPDYRLRDGEALPTRTQKADAALDAAEDLNSAIQFLRENDFGHDPNRILLAGGSAGGMTTLAYAYANPARGFNHDGVKAVGVLWGSPYKEAEPLLTLTDKFPVFIIHGDNDSLVEVDCARKLYASLQAIMGENAPPHRLSYVEVPGGVHTLSNIPDKYDTYIMPGLSRLFTQNA